MPDHRVNTNCVMLQKEKKLKDKNHFRALGKMYLSAPINEIFKPLITISDGSAEIEIEVKR
jgi:hypothetical protein